MSNKTAILALIVALVSLMLVVLRPSGNAPETKKETAYDRVMKTQTLRCGYVVFVPNLVKDPNTGKMSGADYDITEALGHKLGIKVEWTEETGWATAIQGLNTGKYDAVCNAAWINSKQGRETYFSRPYYYQPLFTIVRANDTRFDGSLDSLNGPNIKIGSQDGDDPQFIAEEDFPQAHVFALPDMSGNSLVLEAVASGKADATFMDAYEFGDYNDHNPGKLKMVQLERPVRIYPVGFILPMGDDRFRAMIDTAMDELIYSGQINKILRRYDKYPYNFIPVERPHTLEHIGS